jgi:uncharacterized membrane protein YdjX (TVP38/TMEM64 family)
MKNSKGMILKIVVLCAIAAAAIYFASHYNIREFTPRRIRNTIVALGPSGPIVFVALYTIRPLILFPANIFSTAGGLAFGTALGALYNYIGAVMSSILAFWVARLLGRDFIERLFGNRMKRFDLMMEKSGFSIVFYLRFFSPFDPLSYACGLSKLKFGQYLIATMIPIIPGTIAYSYFGSSFSKIESWHDLLSGNFLIPALVLIITLFIPLAVKKLRPAGKQIQ